jgi:hypothetical protein
MHGSRSRRQYVRSGNSHCWQFIEQRPVVRDRFAQFFRFGFPACIAYRYSVGSSLCFYDTGVID